MINGKGSEKQARKGLFWVQKRISIVYKALDELIPDAKNPRRNDGAVAPVMESIREFGFRVPIVIDKNNVIRAGHTRYKAAQQLNILQVPCVVASDLNEKQLKAFQLADNKTGELATWDLPMLNLEMSDLASIFDMSLFGFSKKEEKNSSGTESTKGSDQYVICPRCGVRFLRSEGHPDKSMDAVFDEPDDSFLDDGDGGDLDE